MSAKISEGLLPQFRADLSRQGAVLSRGVKAHGLGLAATHGPAIHAFDVDALRWREACDVKPSPQRLKLVSDTIKQMRKCNAWPQLDVFYLLAAHDSQASLINLKNPGRFTMTPINSPTYTVDRGWQGDGLTMQIDTGYAPATQGISYQLNSMHMGIYINTSEAGAGRDCGNAASVIRLRSAPSTHLYRANDGTDRGTAASITTAPHYGLLCRQLSGTVFFTNGLLHSSDSVSATAINPATLRTLSQGTSFSNRRQSAFHAGGDLSAQQSEVYRILRDYMIAVGAA